MRTLKYAILGLINNSPLTGYDITKKFNQGLVDFWYAKHSQIYPELKKLTEEGLITYETVIQGEKLEKKLYTITDKGITAFQKWLNKDEPLPPTPKDVFRLKTYFCSEMDKDSMIDLFRNELDKHIEKLNYLEEAMNSIETEKENLQDIHSPDFGDYLVLNGAIMRENNYIAWIKNCINKIETADK